MTNDEIFSAAETSGREIVNSLKMGQYRGIILSFLNFLKINDKDAAIHKYMDIVVSLQLPSRLPLELVNNEENEMFNLFFHSLIKSLNNESLIIKNYQKNT